jgi:hypothetical protein
MDQDIARYQQWLEPSNTRSRKAPIERLHFVKRSMTRNTIMHPGRRVSMQCMQGEDGKFYYIPLDAYNPDHLQIISELSPLLVNPTPEYFEPGAMYTYIIASIITKDPSTGMDRELEPMKLYASKAMNMFEFGTKHHQIFYRMASTDELDRIAMEKGIATNAVQYALHASGEIYCIAPNLLKFNFFSGTYKMEHAIPKRRAPYEVGLITRLMQTIDPSYEITPHFKAFIVAEVLPITQEQIDYLRKHLGIPAFGFVTQDKCRDMRIAIIRHKNIEKTDMTYEEMHAKYQQILNPPPAPAPINAYIMNTLELTAYAAEHNLPIPDPYTKDEMRKIVQAHMGKSGGKKRRITLKKRKRH